MDIDVVIIGLNASGTLQACLESVRQTRYTQGRIHIHYVDSGSTDNSPALAAEVPGVQVITPELDYPSPGAARNAGWKAGSAPLVQFLDSDTLLDPDWFEQAVPNLRGSVVAVRGFRREAAPDRSVYNWIADLEWNADPGLCEAFGGDVLVSRRTLEETGGYDPELVGGEDPELSRRIVRSGKSILQLDHLMTRHDLDMHTVRQYWVRAYRTGYGYAAVTDRHRREAGPSWLRDSFRILLRGGVAPALTAAGLLLAPILSPLTLFPSLIGMLLWFYPRLFRTAALQEHFRISSAEAKTYALHCSLVVVPECLGMIRYAYGRLFRKPLRNSRKPLHLRRRGLAAFVSGLAFLLPGCVHLEEGVQDIDPLATIRQMESAGFPADVFKTAPQKAETHFASDRQIEAFSNSVPDAYLLGPGDLLSIQVRGRPDASIEKVLIAPDGILPVPRLGLITAEDKTTAVLTEEIKNGMSRFYQDPEVTIVVHEFKNNKAFVLGRVSNPGVVNFAGQGTLLEALSMSGGLPTVAEEAFLTRAMIFRGRDEVIWVDLRELLNNGNMAMNPRLKNNDVVYIPESDDQLVYVMGQVENPGAIRLKSDFTALDAIMASGGPTVDAKFSRVFLIRYVEGKGYVKSIELDTIVEKGDLTTDFLVENGDILYVGPKNMYTFDYYLSKISPAIWYLNFAQEAFGN